MVSDEELDQFIEEEVDKDITQEDSIDPSVDEHLQQMGFLWDRMQNKLKDDKSCFACKKEVDFEKEKLHLREASKTDKGVIAFVSVCNACIEKNEKKVKKNE